MLVVPTQILKVVLPNNKLPVSNIVRYHTIIFLVDVLKSVKLYLSNLTCMEPKNSHLLKKALQEHVIRHFPSALTVMENYNSSSNLESYSSVDYINIALDLLELYCGFSESLLSDMYNTMELTNMLQEIEHFTEDTTSQKLHIVYVKIVKLLLIHNQAVFSVENELFASILLRTFKIYYELRDFNAHNCLHRILINTGVFERCESEVDIWIDSIFNMKEFENSVPEFLITCLKLTSRKLIEFTNIFTEIHKDSHEDLDTNIFEDMFEDLMNNKKNVTKCRIKNVNLSPMIFGVLESSADITHTSKSVKRYIDFVIINLLHTQTNMETFFNIVMNRRSEIFSKNIVSYILSWKPLEGSPIFKMTKGELDILSKFSEGFTSGKMESLIEKYLKDVKVYEYQVKNLLNMAIFYVINYTRYNILSKDHIENCLIFIDYVLEKKLIQPELFYNICLSNAMLLRYLSCCHLHKTNSYRYCTEFVVKIIQMLNKLNYTDFDVHLEQYRAKFFESLLKTLKKQSRVEGLELNILLTSIETMKFDIEQCNEFLTFVSNLKFVLQDEGMPFAVLKVIVQFLYRYIEVNANYSSLKCLNGEVIGILTSSLRILNCKAGFDTSSFAGALKIYLEKYPHSIKYVNVDLFESIIRKQEFCGQNLSLAVLLLKSNTYLVNVIIKNMEEICTKKGVVLSLLETMLISNVNDETLRDLYLKIEGGIMKILQKPHKNSKHFELNYKAIGVLVDKFISLENSKQYFEKVHKFEVTEVFHVYLMEIVYSKCLFDFKHFNEKIVNNCLLVFLHFSVNILKKIDDKSHKICDIMKIFNGFVQKICDHESLRSLPFTQVRENETFLTFCKYSLKYGISKEPDLLKVLSSLVRLLRLTHDDSNLIMEMIFSHSEFVDVMLKDDVMHRKSELLTLILELCMNCKSVMQRNHIPVLLAAYSATWRSSDQIIFSLLKL